MTPEQFGALREGDRIKHPMAGTEWMVTMILDRSEGQTMTLVATTTIGLGYRDAKEWLLVPKRRVRT